MKHVVLFSFGVSSWATAKLVVRQHGAANTLLLFCDTKIEDEDTYRWGREAAANVGAELVTIADGRDPWQVFRDERYLGNSRADPCSKILKREMLDRYFKANFTPDTCIRYAGIHWSEEDRIKRLKARLAPWRVEAPLCEPPLIAYSELHAWARREGLKPQRLYEMGFAHANCGGFCIKAGHAHFRRLLQVMPERYAYHEAKEQEMREFLGKDVSILSDRKNGTKTPLTLLDLRKRIEAGCQGAFEEWGGCACFSSDDQ